MKERKPVFEIPEKIKQTLQDKGIETKEVLVFAQADMDVSCEFCRQILILCRDKLIHGYDSYKGITANDKRADYNSFCFEEF